MLAVPATANKDVELLNEDEAQLPQRQYGTRAAQKSTPLAHVLAPLVSTTSFVGATWGVEAIRSSVSPHS